MRSEMSEREQVRFWRAPEFQQLELLRAHYVTHSYARHTHETFAIGVIEAGAEGFSYRHATHTAPAGTVVAINPSEAHTGHAVSAGGWTYRMLYPDVTLLQQAASAIAGREQAIPYFAAPVMHDSALATQFSALHRTLESSSSALERESALFWTLAQLIARHAERRPLWLPLGHEHGPVAKARTYLEEHAAENVSLERLASVAGLSPFHLLRVFRETLGLPPHAYLTQQRVRQAKTLLARGMPLAQVALETGFTDQSHLTRHFKRLVGVTPGQYARGSKNVQERLALPEYSEGARGIGQAGVSMRLD